MPQATDLANLLATQLWALLQAQPTVTAAVLPSNANKGDASGWFRDTIANLPLDRRRLSIALTRFTNNGYITRGGFAGELPTYADTDGDAFNVERIHEFTLIYKEPLPKDPGSHPIKEAIEQTMYLAGPRLGLDPPVIAWRWQPNAEVRVTRKGEPLDPSRVTTMRISITTYQDSLALVAQTV